MNSPLLQDHSENTSTDIDPNVGSRKWSRRRFLAAGVAGGVSACAATGAWAFWGAPHDVEIVRVDASA
ncbi:MAG: hypothetical protein ACKVHE_06900 [Planctomycetales bacterium]